MRPLIHPAFRLPAGREDKVYSSGGMGVSVGYWWDVLGLYI